MPQFLYCKELYETIQQKSQETKEILWVCSPHIGLNAHEIFSQEILKKHPADVRFVLRVNNDAVKKGSVSPYEIQYLMEHFGTNSVKSHDGFNSNIYIFDDSALITSASLVRTTFESSIETGVILAGSEVDKVKNFFDQSLWQNAKSIGDLSKLKQIWNSTQKSSKEPTLKKVKPHTQIKNWTDDYTSKWYIGVSLQLPAKTERKIKKETNWPKQLSLVGDVAYQTFRELKLGDLAYLADLSKRGKVEIKLARIFDKGKVETDQGDLHVAYETLGSFLLERERFYEMLKNAGISSRTFEAVLNQAQLARVIDVLSSIKHKRKRKKP